MPLEERGRVRGKSEPCGMTEGNYSRKPQQQVKTKGEYREYEYFRRKKHCAADGFEKTGQHRKSENAKNYGPSLEGRIFVA
jgi:hypothetical protein